MEEEVFGELTSKMKVLIENLETNPSLRRLCGWVYRSQVPSEATFSRTIKAFSEQKLLDVIHGTVVTENYKDKIVGHSKMDSVAFRLRRYLRLHRRMTVRLQFL